MQLRLGWLGALTLQDFESKVQLLSPDCSLTRINNYDDVYIDPLSPNTFIFVNIRSVFY